MEHMVQPLVLPGALHSSHVLGVGHHADGGLVPLGAGADGAGAVPVRQILADRAAVDRRLGTDNRLGEGVGLIIRHGQDIEGQPLGGFDAHAGQLGELLHQSGGKVLHGFEPPGKLGV